jgi:hypothetical protein
MSEAPGRTEVATTQLLPCLAVGGNLAGELVLEFQADCERAERVCARVRVQPHTWEACTRTYLQDQEVRDVARDLGLTLSGVYKARDWVRRRHEEEGQAESLPPVGNGAPL